jgi:hypothetical protein
MKGSGRMVIDTVKVFSIIRMVANMMVIGSMTDIMDMEYITFKMILLL